MERWRENNNNNNNNNNIDVCRVAEGLKEKKKNQGCVWASKKQKKKKKSVIIIITIMGVVGGLE